MFAAVDVPEIEFPTMRSTDTSRAKTAQRHPMKWAIVQIALVAHGVGFVPIRDRTDVAK